MKRVLIACIIAAGFAGVSVALGMLYLDYTRREGAWVESTMRRNELTQVEMDELMSAWEVHDTFVPSLLCGTAGVALLGLGLTLALFELRVFNRPGPPPLP
jgi:hypothetical protein